MFKSFFMETNLVFHFSQSWDYSVRLKKTERILFSADHSQVKISQYIIHFFLFNVVLGVVQELDIKKSDRA